MKSKEFAQLIEKIKSRTYPSVKVKIIPELVDLYVFDKGISYDQFDLLVDALKYNLHITKLALTGNDIGDKGALCLASIKTLNELEVQSCNISVVGATALAGSNLKKLSLAQNNIKYYTVLKDQFIEMTKAFILNSTITDLDFSGCYIPSGLISYLIERNKTIKVLTVSNYLGDVALDEIGSNKTLEELYITGNTEFSDGGITDRGAGYIFRNNSLKKLEIIASKITDEGAKLLSQHSTLRELSLWGSRITTKGAEFFINSNLKKVLLTSSCMSEAELFKFEGVFKASRGPASIISKEKSHEHKQEEAVKKVLPTPEEDRELAEAEAYYAEVEDERALAYEESSAMEVDQFLLGDGGSSSSTVLD